MVFIDHETNSNHPKICKNRRFYPVGPPYILHVDDLKEMAETWVRFVPKIYEEYPQLLAEMYAYCMAAAHLNLKHFKIDNLMISNVDAGGEGWPWVDKFSKSSSCDQYRNGKMAYAVSTELDKDKPIYPGNLPSVLHFCQVCSLPPIAYICCLDCLFLLRTIGKVSGCSARGVCPRPLE